MLKFDVSEFEKTSGRKSFLEKIQHVLQNSRNPIWESDGALDFYRYRVKFRNVLNTSMHYSETFPMHGVDVTIGCNFVPDSEVIMPKFLAEMFSRQEDIVLSNVDAAVQEDTKHGVKKLGNLPNSGTIQAAAEAVPIRKITKIKS